MESTQTDKTKRPVMCKNPHCKLYNVRIDPSYESFYDSGERRLIKFGNDCPACGVKLTILTR